MKTYLPLFTSSIRLISFVVILPFININESIAANITWTGTTDTDWNTASNWSPAQVPTSSDIVTIPNVTNDPIISANDAEAISVTVNSGAVLTITAAGVLSLDGTENILLYLNAGTVENSGIINIGQTANGGNNGIWNGGGTFNNNAGGVINIDHTSSDCIRAINNGDIDNSGTINIGQNSLSGSATAFSIINNSSLDNNAGGVIKIDRNNSSGNAIYYYQSTVNNSGTITIGALSSSSKFNTIINNLGSSPAPVFNNNSGGIINIHNANNAGLQIRADGTFNNNSGATINIYEFDTRGLQIDADGTFNNNSGATINIDGTNAGYFENSGTFDNSGEINIGTDASSSSTSVGLATFSTFNNNSGGQINIDRCGECVRNNGASATFTNEGTITCGANSTISGEGVANENLGTFNNNASGIINIDNTGQRGIFNSSTFTNQGTCNIGLNGSVGDYGIYNNVNFNNDGGTVNIDRASVRGIYNALTGATFDNAGDVTFGAISSPPTLISNWGFSNNSNGTITGSGSILSSGFTNNSGTIRPGNSPGIITFSGAEDFSNSTLEVEINGTGTAGTDFDQIVCTGAATLSSASTILNVTTNYSPSDGDQVLIFDATSLVGTFSASSSLGNWTIAYNSPSNGDVTLTYVVPPIESTQTGDWSDVSTWVGGVVPVAGDEVILKNGHVITINGTTANCGTVTVESGGTLDNRGTLNNTGLAIIDAGGALTSFNSATYGTGGLLINGSYVGTTQGGNFFLTCNGDVTIGTTGSVDSDVEFQGVGGTFTNNGTITDLVVSGFSFINSSTGHIDLSGGSGFEIKESNFTNNAGGMITTGGAFLYNANNVASVSFANNGTVNIGSGTTFTLLRSAGVSLDLSNFDPIAGALNLNLPIAGNSFTFTGSVTNNGAINCVGCGTTTPLIFGGGSFQTIDGAGTIEASNAQFGGQINIDNSSNIELAGSQSMESDYLHFVNGKLILSGAGDITTNTVTGFDASKYVVTSGAGMYKHYIHFNTIETLPVGHSTSGYNPLTIRPTNTFSEFSVNVSNGLNNSTGPDYVDIEWDITPTNSPTADLTFQWNSPGDETGAFDPNNCAVGHWNGASWDIVSPNAAASCGSGVCSRTATGVSSFSPFGVGEANSLPVELIDFQAKVQEGRTVLLDWRTATELNNEGFEIERSINGKNWERLGFVAGTGTTFENQQYNFTDARPFSGMNYYRLKQMDFDGAFAYTNIISVIVDVKTNRLSVFPNPAINETTLALETDYIGEATLSLYDFMGQRVKTQTVFLEGIAFRISMDLVGLPGGVYLVEVHANREYWQERLVLK
ncbi:MAG: T9SS type A sorting domain-containing protein [Bacteroidota bacterium]